ncbi:ammonium transporter AmtB-like domain-containing protein [Tuber indicum]|nr:ammonium transporter AmtB-like domain-containing protein [Tuber indicum]
MDYDVACTVVVWSIIPGIGFLYGGLVRKHASLGLLWQSFLVSAVISFQWLVIFPGGFAEIATDKSGGGLGIHLPTPEPGEGDLIVVFFCVVTIHIMISSALERGRLLASLLFGFAWATAVYRYCPLACYAGGGPVHVASGFSALAYTLHRQTPDNVAMVFLGTWFGWLCFNGGGALNATIRPILLTCDPSCGIIGWVTAGYFRKKEKFSVAGACEGAIAGLVGITPAAGYVAVWFAASIAFITAVLHGIGGTVGASLPGIFASESGNIPHPPLLTPGDFWLIYLRGCDPLGKPSFRGLDKHEFAGTKRRNSGDMRGTDWHK